MSSAAIFAQGTLLQIGDGATPTEGFTTIAEVLDISGPELTQNTSDVTNHDSPGGWQEFIGTILSGGTVTFDVNWQPVEPTHSQSTGVIFDLKSRTKRNFKIVFTDSGNTTWTFTALVTNFTPGAPVQDKLLGSVTLQITGQPTLAG